MAITSFVCIKKISLLCLKTKFRQVRNRCKSVLEDIKRAYSISIKYYNFLILYSITFWRIAHSILNKHKSVIPHLLNVLEVLPSAFDQTKLLSDIFSKNSNLRLGYFFTVFSLEIIRNCVIFFDSQFG